jgi:uncharacterized protein YutE (UPF0331/DUF86 family)
MVERDVVLAKIATIDRCLARIEDVRGARGAKLLPIDVEDIVAVNLQRAAQAAIDLAAHVVATEAYGLPTDLAGTFTLLEKNGVIEAPLGDRLRKMVGFRNIAVHQYEAIDARIMEAIVTRHLEDLRALGALVVARFDLT